VNRDNSPFLIDPILFARHLLGFHPDPIQQTVLTSTAWRGLINCTRQWGKSTIMAVKALHEAHNNPGRVVLVLCPSLRQAGNFYLKLRHFLRTLRYPLRGDGVNNYSFVLPNESSVVCLSDGCYTRSFGNVCLLLLDEAAEVEDRAYFEIRPTVSTVGEDGGKIWMMSTPQGREGVYWHAWELEGDRWERFSVTALECPRISRKFLEEEREILGARLFGQEYLCQFIERPDCLFNREDIYRALRPDVPRLELNRSGLVY
jgi:hypothetical protein